MPNPIKSLGYIKCCSSSSPRSVKSPRNYINYKIFLLDLSLTFLNTRTSNDTFQQSGKQDHFRHLLESSASMYESSGSQFFRITTRIQSGLDAFDVSRLVTTFLTILGVTGILCNFRSDLEGKTGTEIPEIPVFAFCLRSARFTFVENNISSFLKAVGAKFLGNDELSCFICICKFGSFKNPFAMITSLPEVYFRFRRFFFYLGFLSQTFTIHKIAGEEGGYLFNSSLPLPPASKTLKH